MIAYHKMGGALFGGRTTLMEKKMLSVRDATNELRARGFSITERGVREEIKAKRLRAYNVRRTYYISREDLDAYIQASETKPPEGVAC
jgi:excisionase family DNA binding protein